MSLAQGLLEPLAAEIVRRILPVDLLAPIGCHHCHHEDVHELTIFVGSTETHGGAGDGATVASRFYFDLAGIVEHFDEVSSFHWQPLTIDGNDDLGPHVSVEGLFQGERVWLRVTAKPPELVSPARLADAYAGQFVELW